MTYPPQAPTIPSAFSTYLRMLVCRLCVAGATWVLSVVLGIGSSAGTSDPSIVDRLWSILPVVYVWHMLLSSEGPPLGNLRLLVMAVLVTLWGSRLTFNFWLKGGFSGARSRDRCGAHASPLTAGSVLAGGEDYRWTEVHLRACAGACLACPLLCLRSRAPARGLPVPRSLVLGRSGRSISPRTSSY